MAAQKGNKFWELRSKHGRDRLFSNAEDLWNAACEYFEWAQSNPLIEIDFVGKDAMQVEKPKMRPFTIHALCCYLDCNTVYFNHFDPPTEDFSKVITRIREIIYNQKFEGAAAGFLNPNIIARDLGLKDSSDITTNGNPIVNEVDYSKLSDEVLTALLNAKHTTENKS